MLEPRPAIRSVKLILVVTVLLLTTGVGRPGASQQMTMEERIAGHLALEQVMFRHRSEAAMQGRPDEASDESEGQRMAARQAERVVRMSSALETRYGVRLTGERLQAELDRMARTSLDPGRLAEYFAALSEDPRLAAECLARPVLADNILRDRFAWDDRVHGALRSEAEVAWSAARPDALRELGGSYSESEWVRVTDPWAVAGAEPEPIDGPTYVGDDDWRRLGAKLRRDLGLPGEASGMPLAGTVGRLQENEYSFFGTAIIESTVDRVRVAQVTWRKQDFHDWWETARSRYAAEISAPEHPYRLPEPVGAEAKATAGGDWWKRVTATGAPSARSGHEAVWTGSEMVVWGGWAGNNSVYFRSGGMYDPATNSWTAMNTSGAPDGRREFTAIPIDLDIGPKMVVWGGYGGASLNTGAMYRVYANSWQEICSASPAPCNAPEGRRAHAMIDGGRYGEEFTMWGGVGSSGQLDTGASYLIPGPSDGVWYDTDTTDPDQPSARSYHTGVKVWDGMRARMMIWGGDDRLETGALLALDPVDTDLWLPVSTSNTPPGRERHAAIAADLDGDPWAARESVFIWGGYTWGADLWSDQGGVYDVHLDAWTLPSTDGAPAGRQNLRMVWTGHEAIVWGGDQTSTCTDTGGRYNPASDSWSRTDTSDAQTPSPRTNHTAVWTGTGMIVWGGYDLVDRLGNGAMYLSCYGDPTGPGSVGAYDVDDCNGSGLQVVWTNVASWGDYHPDRRTVHVFRNGAPIMFGGCAGPIPYDTWSCIDDVVTPGDSVEYTIAFVNACGRGIMTPTPATGTDLEGAEPVVTAACTVADADSCVAGTGIEISWPYSPGGDWGDGGSGERRYRVWRWHASTGWQAIGSQLPDITNTYTDLTALPGQVYRYRVRYINGCGLSAETAESADVVDVFGTAPSVSQMAAAIDADTCDHTGIQISWPADPDSWGDHDTGDRLYRVRRSTDGVNFNPIGDNLTYGTTTYVDTNVSPDQTYHYEVRYKNGCGDTADSLSSSATDEGSAAPTGLAVAQAVDEDDCDHTGIRVTWPADPGDWGDHDVGDRTYRVLRSTDGVTFDPVGGDLAYGTTSYLDTGAAADQAYQYKVRYTNGCGLDAESGAASATDRAGAAPTALGALAVTDPDGCADDGVVLSWPADAGSWGDNGAGLRTYDVLRDGVAIATDLAYGTSTFTDTTGANGVSYLYEVRYTNGCGLAATTAGVSGSDEPTAPSPPAGNNQAVDLSGCAPTGILVTWDPDPDGGWGDPGDPTGHTYEVLRDGVPVQSGIPYGTTMLVDDAATPGTSHLYTVRYRNCGGLYFETSGATAVDASVAGCIFSDGFEHGSTVGWR